jgi:heat shock protein HspQ
MAAICLMVKQASRSRQAKRTIAQALRAALDVWRGVAVDFVPAFAAIDAAEDVEAL